jgi:hypothetical protein
MKFLGFSSIVEERYVVNWLRDGSENLFARQEQKIVTNSPN